MTYLIVDNRYNVLVECSSLLVAELAFSGRVDQILIETDKTIYDSPIDSLEVFNGVIRFAERKKLLEMLKGMQP